MRFQSVTALLQVALAKAAVDVTYGSERRLDLIGTYPEVDVEYDGTNATCEPGTGRRFHGERTDDGDCSDPHSWELVYMLENSTITIISCPVDKVLKISSTNPGSVPTAHDCRFLFNLQTDLVKQPRYKDKLSLEAHSAKGIEVVCGWPAGLPMSHTVDWSVEAAYQRAAILHADAVQPYMSLVGLPINDFMYDDYYQSLCFAMGDNKKWIYSYNNAVWGKLDMSPPCGGTDHMNMSNNSMSDSDMSCLSVPQDGMDGIDWAKNNCFGRCGVGCGLTTQFTNDCADYDFCTRLMIDRQVANDNCTYEFLRTIDDTMFSGNCDEDTMMEEKPDECTEAPTPSPQVIPTSPPTAAPVLPLDVLTTWVVGGSCTDACNDYANFVCSPQILQSHNFAYQPTTITMMALSIGAMCASVGATDNAPSSAKLDTNTMECIPSWEPRNLTEFDCDATVGANQMRFCTCREVR